MTETITGYISTVKCYLLYIDENGVDTVPNRVKHFQTLSEAEEFKQQHPKGSIYAECSHGVLIVDDISITAAGE